jgi:hypothetical protein
MNPVCDTLAVSMETVSTELIETAEKRYKCFVQEPHLSPWVEHARWTLGPGRLQGQHGYDFIADGKGTMDGVRVLWGLPKRGEAPRARRFKVYIESKVLWRHHVNGGNAYTAASETLEWITGDLWGALPIESEIAVRRLDLAIDHKGYAWKKTDLDRFACRQRIHGVTEEHAPDQVNTIGKPESATYTVGARGTSSRYLRIYQKIAEAMKSGKMPWMDPIWRRELEWDGVENIWRIEVEFGGEWLRAHGFTDISKLKGCEAALWLDYLEDVRHTTATRTRLERSPTSRVWSCIAAAVNRAARESDRATWSWQPRPPREGGDLKQLTAMLGGCGKKVKKLLFKDPTQKAQLLEFLAEAIANSEQRERDREAKRSRHNPRPPPPPRREAS